jgi:RNA polymerase sigma-70 factor, ECF subfamily
VKSIERILRDEGGQVLATLIRFTRDFDLAEDSLQDALVEAVEDWERRGIPNNPGAWLTTVARRKALDRLRREGSRKGRESQAVFEVLTDLDVGSPSDDLLRLIFTCCHPALSSDSRVALTLRTVLGLTTAEIARTFLVPDATIGQRISRAKRKIKVAKIPYRVPADHELPERLPVVLATLYAAFTAGHHAPVGPLDARGDVAEETIRVARLLATLMPDEPEVWGLLALMLATHARRAARLDERGHVGLLADQDRSRWDHDAITEADGIVSSTLRRGRAGRYLVQAAIACLHGLAPDEKSTDWMQIAELYRALEGMEPTGVVRVNRAVAEARAHGPEAGLAVLASAEGVEDWHLYWSTRAALLAETGDAEGARSCYRRALECRPNDSDRAFLEQRLAQVEAVATNGG